MPRLEGGKALESFELATQKRGSAMELEERPPGRNCGGSISATFPLW